MKKVVVIVIMMMLFSLGTITFGGDDGVNSMKEMNPDSIGCWIVCGVGCLAVCLLCIADGPVPIADVAGSTSGSKTSLASASFI